MLTPAPGGEGRDVAFDYAQAERGGGNCAARRGLSVPRKRSRKSSVLRPPDSPCHVRCAGLLRSVRRSDRSGPPSVQPERSRRPRPASAAGYGGGCIPWPSTSLGLNGAGELHRAARSGSPSQAIPKVFGPTAASFTVSHAMRRPFTLRTPDRPIVRRSPRSGKHAPPSVQPERSRRPRPAFAACYGGESIPWPATSLSLNGGESGDNRLWGASASDHIFDGLRLGLRRLLPAPLGHHLGMEPRHRIAAGGLA